MRRRPSPVLGRPDRSRSLRVTSGTTFIARGAGAGLMLAAQIIIARQVGVANAGRIAIALTLAGLASVIGRYGVDQLVLRRVAIQSEGEAARRELAMAVRVSTPILLVLGGAMLLFAEPLADHALGDAPSALPLRWLALAVPAFGLVGVQGEAIKGLGAPVLASVVQSVVGPAITVGVLLTPFVPESVHVASAALSFGYIGASVAALIVWRLLGSGNTPAVGAAAIRDFVREATPFFGTSLLVLALTYVPIVALAINSDPAEVGRYFAAERWTQIPSMMLVAINATVAPLFARAWAEERTAEVSALLTRSSRHTLALAAGVSAALFIGAPWLLKLFGESYSEATSALRILSVAQFVILACGPVTTMVVMTGGEVAQRRATGFAAILVIILCAFLVPPYGLVGAACASAIALITNKLLIVGVARRTLHRAASRS